jgi:hypothetical protein
MKLNVFSAALAAGLMIASTPAVLEAATVTTGPGGFDDGWATSITYEDDNTIARRGTNNGRDDPLNALGAPDGDFFEIGFGSTVDLTFGVGFNTSASVFEVTFNSVPSFPESVDLYVGDAGTFQFITSVSNLSAQGGVTVALPSVGSFDTVRLIDTSPLSSSIESDAYGPLGGFDLAGVRVAPIPLPAAGWMLLAGLGGLAMVRRRQKA